MKKTIIIACGGTGGHLFPGVAVAQELRDRGHQVRLLISEKKVDAQASEKYGDLQFDTLPAIAKPPTFSVKMLPFLFKLWKTRNQSKKMLKAAKADAVLGMGGFTSLAPIIAGKQLQIPCFVHDSNALPGKANRLTARFCHTVLLGLEDARSFFPSNQVEITGTPVRSELTQTITREQAAKKLNIDPKKKTVLVMGGSQGAKKLNSLIVEASKAMPEVQFLHITGTGDYERVKTELGHREGHHLIQFCDDMGACYAASNLAVSRSGASSMTELAYVGLPSILVPYPHAADDHQTFNAEAFAKEGAARLCQEKDLDGGSLLSEISALLSDEENYNTMQAAMKKQAQPNAAAQISKVIEDSFQ